MTILRWLAAPISRWALFALAVGFAVTAVVAGAVAGSDLSHADPVFLGAPLRRLADILFFSERLTLAERLPMSVSLAQDAFVAAGGALVLAMLLCVSRRRLVAWAAATSQQHVVLCGDTPEASACLRSLAEQGTSVVQVVDAASPDAATSSINRSVLRIVADPASETDLARAGVDQARAVILLRGASERNMASCLAIERLCERHRDAAQPPLRCVIGSASPDLAAFEPLLTLTMSGRRVERRAFVPERAVVRQLFRDHPPHRLLPPRSRRSIRALLLGANALAAELALGLVRQCTSSEDRPTIVVVEDRAGDWRTALGHRHLTLAALCRLEVRDASIYDWHTAVAQCFEGSDATPFDAIFVCHEGLAQVINTVAALQIVARGGTTVLPVIFVQASAGRHVVACLEEDAETPVLVRLVPMGVQDEVFSQSILLDDELDTLAQAVHADYLESIASFEGDTAERPAVRPWTELAEAYREASREQADHAAVKTGLIGCRAAPISDREPAALTAGEVEALARLEHQRWIVERLLSGWTPASERDDRLRWHPAIRPFDDLSEADKSLDRGAVENLPRLLARMGKHLTRDIVIGIAGCGDSVPEDEGFLAAAEVVRRRVAEASRRGHVVLLSCLTDPASRRLVRFLMQDPAMSLAVPLVLPGRLASRVWNTRDDLTDLRTLTRAAERIFVAPQLQASMPSQARCEVAPGGHAEYLARWFCEWSDELVTISSGGPSGEEVAAGLSLEVLKRSEKHRLDVSYYDEPGYWRTAP